MAGTKEGGKLAAQTNKELHGADFYVKIGALGGAASGTGGFAQGEAGRERAKRAGRIGGKVSKRTKLKEKP